MFYVEDGKVYIKEGKHFLNVGFTAKDKVVTTRQLESTEIVIGNVKKNKLDNAVCLTREEVIAKFNLSEGNPIPLIEDDSAQTAINTPDGGQ